MAEPVVFVEGIGPPLRQIAEDYAELESGPAEDVRALIAEVLRLHGRIATAERSLKQAADEFTHGATASMEYVYARIGYARLALAGSGRAGPHPGGAE